MTIEQKVDGRSLRHPFTKAVWVPIKIFPNAMSNPEIKLGKKGSVIPLKQDGSDVLVYIPKHLSKKAYKAVDNDINKRRTPWAGKIRRRP